MNTKQQLIREASKLFAERGFGGTSIRDITEAAGANLAAINYHFGSKDALFAVVIHEKTQPLKRKVQVIAQSIDSPVQKLEKILYEYAMHILHKEPSLKAFFSEAIHGGEHLPPQAIESLAERDQIVEGIIREGIKEHSFRRCNVKHATWMLFGTLAPFILYQPFLKPKYKQDPYPKTEVEKIVDSAWNIFIHGMQKEKRRSE